VNSLIAPHVKGHSTLGTGCSLVALVAGQTFLGRMIAALDFRATYEVNIIARISTSHVLQGAMRAPLKSRPMTQLRPMTES
jgi:hypothetical protein